MERDTAALLEEVGESGFGPKTPVRWLSVAQQQVVEIIKARSLNAKILVLDEPTAALAEGEVELLFKLVRRLQELGVGVLYISHRLREVFALSDRITVIKDGGVVKTLDTASTNQRELVNLMVGRELDGYFPEKGAKEDLGDVRLSVKSLTTGAAARRQLRRPRGRDRRSRRAAGLRAARRSRAPSSAPTRSPRARSRSTARNVASSIRARRSRPASGSSPRTARPRASPSPSRSRTT